MLIDSAPFTIAGNQKGKQKEVKRVPHELNERVVRIVTEIEKWSWQGFGKAFTNCQRGEKGLTER